MMRGRDTPDTEAFPTMREMYIRHGDFFLVLVSVSSPEPVKRAIWYAEEIKRCKGTTEHIEAFLVVRLT